MTHVRSVLGIAGIVTFCVASSATAQVTFTKDIAPILQRSCQNCHRSDGEIGRAHV